MTFFRLSSFKKVLTVLLTGLIHGSLNSVEASASIMRVSLRKTTIPSTYSLCGNILPSVLECIDLGVYVDCALFFSNHISTIVAKAKLRSSQILRFFLSKDPVVLVKHLLSMCVQFWNIHRLFGHLLWLRTLTSWSQFSDQLRKGFQECEIYLTLVV